MSTCCYPFQALEWSLHEDSGAGTRREPYLTGSDIVAATAAKSLQSCLTLCDPIDGCPPGSPIPGILQARTLEWVAISFCNAWKWKVKGKSLSRVRLFLTPWTAAYQAPPSMGFSRQEHWSGLPFPSPRRESEKWKWSRSVMSDSSRPHGLQLWWALCNSVSWMTFLLSWVASVFPGLMCSFLGLHSSCLLLLNALSLKLYGLKQ